MQIHWNIKLHIFILEGNMIQNVLAISYEKS